MIKKLLLLLIPLIVLNCKKDSIDNYKPMTVSDYMPVSDKFKTWIFDVDEITFNSFTQKTDTLNYHLIEQFDTFFLDNLNRPAARFSQYKRENDSAAWEFQLNFYKIILPDYFEEVKNNVRYIRLSFPAGLDIIWDENSRNSISQNLLFYTFINQDYTGLYAQYTNAIKTESEPIFNNFEQRHVQSIYAKNIGLVYSKSIQKRKIGGYFDGFERTLNLIEVK